MSHLAIGQARNRLHTSGVKLPMMAMGVSDGLITTHPTDRVLNDNPPLGEGLKVTSLLPQATLFEFG